MDLPSVIVVSLALLAAAVWLIVSHLRSWREFQQEKYDAEDFEYRRRQFRRRMQTSAMLGILAVAVLVGYVLTWWLRSGWFTGVYWIAVLGLVCWIALLALVDVWATKYHFGRLRDHCMIEQAKLKVELHRLQSIRGNGKAKATPLERKNEQ
jgi:hypothetical protein